MTELRILDLRREKLLKDGGYALILVHQKTIVAPLCSIQTAQLLWNLANVLKESCGKD